jgi:hypothetical protein
MPSKTQSTDVDLVGPASCKADAAATSRDEWDRPLNVDRKGFLGLSSKGRRLRREREEKARSTGDWGEWLVEVRPTSNLSGHWAHGIHTTHQNARLVCMVRDVPTPWGVMRHLVIRTMLGELSWSEKQRLKDEIFGADVVAAEVFPGTSRLVEEAEGYHMWVLPDGLRLPFELRGHDSNTPA